MKNNQTTCLCAGTRTQKFVLSTPSNHWCKCSFDMTGFFFAAPCPTWVNQHGQNQLKRCWRLFTATLEAKCCPCRHCERFHCFDFLFFPEVRDDKVLGEVSEGIATRYGDDSSLEASTSSVPSQPTRSDRATPRRRKAPKQNRLWEAELDKIDEQLAAQNLYGTDVDGEVPACSKRMKNPMELEVLDLLKKYTFEEP